MSVRPSAISFHLAKAPALHPLSAMPDGKRPHAPVLPAADVSPGAGWTRATWSAPAAPSRPWSPAYPGNLRTGLRAHLMTPSRPSSTIGWHRSMTYPRPAGPVHPHRLQPLRRLQYHQAGVYETRADRCHVNAVVLDSDWEAEFGSRGGRSPARAGLREEPGHAVRGALHGRHHPPLLPPRFSSCASRTARGTDDALNLVVEIKGYRRGDAQLKAAAMRQRWVPGVNKLGAYGR